MTTAVMRLRAEVLGALVSDAKLGSFAPAATARLDGRFVALRRAFGSAPLGPVAPTHLAALRRAGIEWSLETYGRDEIARMALLCEAAASLDGEDLVALARACFRRGDSAERRAVLRALPLLPASADLVALAIDACRTHVLPVFEGICCENPFPASAFPEPAFNQMVLKAIFMDVPLARVLGLEARITPELRRMAEDFASERRAAGRPVPPDTYLVASRLAGA